MGGGAGSARCFHGPIKKYEKKRGKTGAIHEKARVEVETRGVARMGSRAGLGRCFHRPIKKYV